MNYGAPSLSSNNTVNMKPNITKKQYPTTNSSLDPVKKQKVVFILGATGAGKSKLSVDIATHFFGEVINSDKIQFYDGLDIITNKLIESEQRGVPHYLLGFFSDPEADFIVDDFNHMVEASLNQITKNGYLPIIAGGSNSYMEALVENPKTKFRSKFECCFIWLYFSLAVQFKHVAKKVDQMVHTGLLDEIREAFKPGADYSLDMKMVDFGVDKEVLLRQAIEETKCNTQILACRQLEKIQRLRNELGWNMHRIDVTPVFEKSGDEAEEAWDEIVLKPSLQIVSDFLKEDQTMTIGLYMI
ncbi:hypothetical protein UlMin_032352 [Ulmus minor]